MIGATSSGLLTRSVVCFASCCYEYDRLLVQGIKLVSFFVSTMIVLKRTGLDCHMTMECHIMWPPKPLIGVDCHIALASA